MLMINNSKVDWLTKKIATGNIDDCLDIVLQPYVDIVNFQCVGAEILIRGICNDEIINPDKFINLFEENGSIFKIDLFSFLSGLGFIYDNHLLSQNSFRFSFNFSPYSFNLPQFASSICRKVSRKIAPRIVLEITESNIPLNNYAISNVLKLRQHGFLIAWDDVNSLDYAFRTLQYFRFDVAKMDKSLLANGKLSLLKKIINIYHEFDTEIIVEGVELQEQIYILREINVRYVQGFFFSPPVSKTDFIKKYI